MGGGRAPCICLPSTLAVILSSGIQPSSLGTPRSLSVHSRRVYTEHARTQLTALEHGVTDRSVSGLLIYRHEGYRLTDIRVTDHQR